MECRTSEACWYNFFNFKSIWLFLSRSALYFALNDTNCRASSCGVALFTLFTDFANSSTSRLSWACSSFKARCASFLSDSNCLFCLLSWTISTPHVRIASDRLSTSFNRRSIKFCLCVISSVMTAKRLCSWATSLSVAVFDANVCCIACCCALICSLVIPVFAGTIFDWELRLASSFANSASSLDMLLLCFGG